MSEKSFLNFERPPLTVMVQASTPKRIAELMSKSVPEGAEAFGMQFCRMEPHYRNGETYRRLFDRAYGRPVYVTNYRHGYNKEKSDEIIADELLELAECGATLCDVMADLFDRQKGEFTTDASAIKKQEKLIERIHSAGGEVLMSSHILEYTPAECVLEIALEQERRGADICKIVTGAKDMSEQIENMRIINLLREKLSVPFLFLSGGESRILRRIGGELGCCMYLCVYEYDPLATRSQPLLSDMVKIRELLLKNG